MRDRLRRAAIALAGVALLCGPAIAEDEAGVFDFYVLALSWSPSFCASEGGRGNRDQCGGEPRAFVVHGLWPQYESGFPQSCKTDEPSRVPQSLVDSMRDIMPGGGLVGGQWRKHGACTGLTQADYLALVRRAYQRVTIPDGLDDPERRQHLSARAIEDAFVTANPGLSPAGLAVSCADGQFREVRLCLTRELDFRRCPEVDRRGCRDGRLLVPADE